MTTPNQLMSVRFWQYIKRMVFFCLATAILIALDWHYTTRFSLFISGLIITAVWGSWAYLQYVRAPTQVCPHCGSHHYEIGGYIPNTPFVRMLRCQRCGQIWPVVFQVVGTLKKRQLILDVPQYLPLCTPALYESTFNQVVVRAHPEPSQPAPKPEIEKVLQTSSQEDKQATPERMKLTDFIEVPPSALAPQTPPLAQTEPEFFILKLPRLRKSAL